MATQTVQRSWWRNLKHLLAGTDVHTDEQGHFQRLTISEAHAYTLPRTTRRIRVANGGAWVSHLREDLVIKAGQTLHLLPDHEGVVVTAVGHTPVELEIYR